MKEVLAKVKPSVVVIITALLASKSRENEIEHGKQMIDACQESSENPHVIFCSNMHAEVSPETNVLIKTKYHIEQYLKSKTNVSYSSLGTTSFFENFNDPVNHNPLTRGKLADLYLPDLPVTHVATLDIGKAAVAMAKDPKKWQGKRLECVASVDTGIECARILSQVSGVPCKYQPALPKLVMKILLPPAFQLVRFLEQQGFVSPNVGQLIKEFRRVVPDAMGPKEWFSYVGKWSDGTNFHDPLPAQTGKITLMIGAAVVVLGAVVLQRQQGA